MLIRTSAPQPATRTTPTGGTGIWVSGGSLEVIRTAPEDYLQKRVMMMRRTIRAVLAMFAMGSEAGVSGVLI